MIAPFIILDTMLQSQKLLSENKVLEKLTIETKVLLLIAIVAMIAIWGSVILGKMVINSSQSNIQEFTYTNDRFVIQGTNIAETIEKYDNTTSLKRVDCDPVKGPMGTVWLCANYHNPTLRDLIIDDATKFKYF